MASRPSAHTGIEHTQRLRVARTGLRGSLCHPDGLLQLLDTVQVQRHLRERIREPLSGEARCTFHLPQIHCVRGQIAVSPGRHQAATAGVTRAVEIAPNSADEPTGECSRRFAEDTSGITRPFINWSCQASADVLIGAANRAAQGHPTAARSATEGRPAGFSSDRSDPHS